MIAKSLFALNYALTAVGLMALLATMQVYSCDTKGIEAISSASPVAAPVTAAAASSASAGARFIGDQAVTSCVQILLANQADREIAFLKQELSVSQKQRAILTTRVVRDYPETAARSATWSSWLDLVPYVAEPTAQKIADTELEFQARLHKLQTVHRERLAREAVISAEYAAARKPKAMTIG